MSSKFHLNFISSECNQNHFCFVLHIVWIISKVLINISQKSWFGLNMWLYVFRHIEFWNIWNNVLKSAGLNFLSFSSTWLFKHSRWHHRLIWSAPRPCTRPLLVLHHVGPTFALKNHKPLRWGSGPVGPLCWVPGTVFQPLLWGICMDSAWTGIRCWTWKIKIEAHYLTSRHSNIWVPCEAFKHLSPMSRTRPENAS